MLLSSYLLIINITTVLVYVSSTPVSPLLLNINLLEILPQNGEYTFSIHQHPREFLPAAQNIEVMLKLDCETSIFAKVRFQL